MSEFSMGFLGGTALTWIFVLVCALYGLMDRGEK